MMSINRVCLIGLVCVLLSGCGKRGFEERRWTEDVLLEDGTTVQIERYVAFNEFNALGGGTYSAVETKSTLAFKNELSSLPLWDFPWTALLLYKGKQSPNWTIVVTTGSCEIWRKEGQPRPPYWQYELTAGKWNRVPVSLESIGKSTNLFYSYWDDNLPEKITSSMTAEKQSRPTVSRMYKQIIDDDGKSYCGMNRK